MNIRQYYAELIRKARTHPWTFHQLRTVPKVFRAKKAAVSDFPELDMPAEPDTMFLWGPVGVGKSHLAAALLARWLPVVMEQDTSVDLKWYYWGDIAASLTAWKSGGVNRNLPVIVLDDITRPDRSAHTTVLRAVINYRWENDLATVITSNLSLSAWDAIDPRIASRLADSYVVEFTGKDRRVGEGKRMEVKSK